MTGLLVRLQHPQSTHGMTRLYAAIRYSAYTIGKNKRISMAALAEIEPRRYLLILKDVRNLYGQHLKFFLPVPASAQKLAHTLSRLKDGINRFHIKYDSGSAFLLAFYQLTRGLFDTLDALENRLRSCSRDFGSDTLDESDWPFELDDASTERLQTQLHPISMGVEIINEATELFVHHEF